MKKSSFIILCLFCFLTFTGCGNKKETKKEEVKNQTEEQEKEKVKEKIKMSNDWKDYTFSINGEVFTFPVSYEELTDVSGFEFKSADQNSMIQKNARKVVNLYINGHMAGYVEILNDTDDDLNYTDTKIMCIGQYLHNVKTNKAAAIVFPGNIKVGDNMTEEDLYELVGEADKVDYSEYENKTTAYYTYILNEETSRYKSYKITIYDGIITELELSGFDKYYNIVF